MKPPFHSEKERLEVKCKTPWHDSENKLVFPYRPLRDLVFVYPDPPPKKLGSKQLIYVPEPYRKKYHNGSGIILAIGPGYMNNKGKYHSTPSELKPGVRVMFDICVPWGMCVEGQDGKEHYVVVCGFDDVRCVVEN